MKIGSWRNVMTKLFIVSFFLDAYSWFSIERFSVTTFILFGAVYIIVEIIHLFSCTNKLKIDRTQGVLLIFVMYEVLDCLLHGLDNITSPLNAIFLFMIYIVNKRDETDEETQSNIKLYSMLMNIMAVYGIYQFFARMLGLPFGDIIIPGHMTQGYNWTDPLEQLGHNVYRSNAIFLEPSFFSQTLAVNILLYILRIIENKQSWRTWAAVSLNGIAMILSFSGTGVIVLFFGAFFYLLTERRTDVLQRIGELIAFTVAISLAIIIVVAQTGSGENYFSHMLKRINAVKVGGSGYLRFISGVSIIRQIWSQSVFFCLFGAGAGTSKDYQVYHRSQLDASGYYKVAGELGLIGLLIYILFLIEMVKKSKRCPNRSVWIIGLSLIPMVACNGAFLQNYVWIYLYMINISTIRRDVTYRNNTNIYLVNRR